MKKLVNYLPTHFLIGLLFGISLQFNFQLWKFSFVKLFLLVFLIGVISLFFHLAKKRIAFIGTSFILFIFIGLTSVYIQDARNYDNFYDKIPYKNSPSVVLKINNILKSGAFYSKYEATVTQVNKHKTKGKILLNIKKDSLQTKLEVDEQLLVKTSFKDLIPPLNPHQFNYKNYLAKQGIYHQVFIENLHYKSLGKANPSLIGLSAQVRNKIQQSLRNYSFSKDEFAVINALLLGQRQEISKELLQSYTNAGAIHILAISGLHIGIILLILSRICKPIERIKHGYIIKTFLIIILLWFFAFIAGLSASVVRAVTMFTFVAIGLSFKRRQLVEHSLISSMFFLLLINPMFLFDVGFQLSYLAVFGIVWVQPKLYNLWKPQLIITDKLWQLFTVSIAAQIGILPISLYYFHQFPGLFLLSNLVIIPFLSCILLLGILVCILAVLNTLPQFLASAYGELISLMNRFVRWISFQEEFLFKNISMSFLLMLAWYVLIITTYQFLLDRKAKKLIYLLCTILVVQSVYIFEQYQINTKNSFIVFHKSRQSVVGYRKGSSLAIFHDMDSLQSTTKKLIQNYSVGERLAPNIYRKNPSVFNFKDEKILFIDSLGIYKLNGLKNAIVVLQYSPKINLVRFIKTMQPKRIIADGTNYKSYINHWLETCKKEKTPFHYTGQNGAFIVSD